MVQPSVLATYQEERKALAQSVIDLDAKLSRAITQLKGASDEGGSNSTAEFLELRKNNTAVVSGIGGR